jgi:uncharacterized membrane protein
VYQGFLYTNGSYAQISFPGAISTIPYAINDSGTVVGEYFGLDNQYHGFIYSKGVYNTFTLPLQGSAIPTGINNLGQIVGQIGGNSFVYSNGSAYLLNDPLGTYGTYAREINDAGQIVGSYYTAPNDAEHTNNIHGFLYDRAPGPIPGTGLLSYIAFGILGFGSIGWKRLNKRRDKLAIA